MTNYEWISIVFLVVGSHSFWLKPFFTHKLLVSILKKEIEYNPKHGQEKSFGSSNKDHIRGLLVMEDNRVRALSIRGIIIRLYRIYYE